MLRRPTKRQHSIHLAPSHLSIQATNQDPIQRLLRHRLHYFVEHLRWPMIEHEPLQHRRPHLSKTPHEPFSVKSTITREQPRKRCDVCVLRDWRRTRMRRMQRNEMCIRREISRISYDGQEGQFYEHEAIDDELDLILRDCPLSSEPNAGLLQR